MKCNFCPLGGEIHLSGNDKIDMQKTRCSVCPRAVLNIELQQHPARLKHPLFYGRKSTYKSIVLDIKQRLNKRTAFLLGPGMTLEETALAIILAGHSGSELIAISIPEDEKNTVLKNRGRLSELKDCETILAIGDPLENSPALFLDFENVDVVNIDNRPGMTSRIAKNTIIPQIGKTAHVLRELIKALEGYSPKTEHYDVREKDIENLARSLMRGGRNAVVFSGGFGHFIYSEMIINLAREISNHLGDNSSFFCLSTGANSRGINRLLRVNNLGGIEKVIDAIEAGRVETLFMFGCDIKQSLPNLDISSIPTRIQTTVIQTHSTREMTHVLPAKLLGEKTGSVLSLEEHIIRLENQIPTPSGFSDENFIKDILENNYAINTWDIAEQLSRYREPKPRISKAKSLRKIVMAGFVPPGHHNDGALTSVMELNRNDKKQVRVSASLAREHKLRMGDRISIFANAPFKTIIDDSLPDNMILVPVSDIDARKGFVGTFEPERAAFAKIDQLVDIKKPKETPYNFQIVNPDE